MKITKEYAELIQEVHYNALDALSSGIPILELIRKDTSRK